MTDGVRIVVLPGWGQNAQHWTQFLHAMGARASALDLPGFGTELLVSDTWGVPEYAEWVKKKIESKGHTRVLLLGHSFGGRIASFIASEKPSWLVGLVLYGAPCLYRPSSDIQATTMLAKILKPFKKLLRAFLPRELKEAEAGGMGTVFRNTVPFDQTSLLPRISVPTLLVWGEKDIEAPLRIAHEMHKLIPESRLAILPSLGHNAHLENPTLFYGTVEHFVRTSR